MEFFFFFDIDFSKEKKNILERKVLATMINEEKRVQILISIACKFAKSRDSRRHEIFVQKHGIIFLREPCSFFKNRILDFLISLRVRY